MCKRTLRWGRHLLITRLMLICCYYKLLSNWPLFQSSPWLGLDYQIIMPTLGNRAAIIILSCGVFLLSSFFFSSPNFNGRRLDVYHTSTHGVAVVQI